MKVMKLRTNEKAMKNTSSNVGKSEYRKKKFTKQVPLINEENRRTIQALMDEFNAIFSHLIH